MSKAYYERTFDRHKRDLEAVENGSRPNMRFNKKLGLAYVAVIEQLHHFEGELAGQKIVLEEWERRSLAICFGWQKKRVGKDGTPMQKDGKPQWIRRFKTAFFFVSRKNGKSIIASGVAIAESVLTTERGNQIVSFATKKDQAKIIWNGCEKMIGYNSDLKKNSTVAYSIINIKPTDTTIKPMGRDSQTEDGLNVGLGIGDEIHAHPDRSMIEVIESSQGARVQPMMFYITTAGFNTASPGYEEYEYAKKVMDGVVEDDSYFAFIAELDPEDDPFDESVWYKANPNLGVSKSWDYMRTQAKKAEERAESKNNFLVKDLNRWTNAAEGFIGFEQWKACAAVDVDISESFGKLLGMDLSRSDDFTALAVTHLLPENRFHTTQRYYIPEDNVLKRERELRVPLSTWVAQGYITATPGSTIDLDYITRDIMEMVAEDNVNELCYDPHRAATMIAEIEKKSGFEGCVQIRQGYLSLSEPTYNLRTYIEQRKLTHDNNPVTNWMMSNLSILTDAAGNIKPDKSHQNRKIDGIAAIINTLARSSTFEPPKKSIYEERGMRTL